MTGNCAVEGGAVVTLARSRPSSVIGFKTENPYGASVGHWNADPRSVA
jgi:hypothetical protein